MQATVAAPRSALQSAVVLAPLAVVLLIALVVDFSTDTPTFGPFYQLGGASQGSSACCAVAIVALALCLLRAPSTRAWPLALHATLRLLPALAALGSFFWTAPLISLR